MPDEGLTWEKLVELEPKLQTLYELALQTGSPLPAHENDPWFGKGGLREQLQELVGRQAPAKAHPVLKMEEAYTLAQGRILSAFMKPPPK
jgi:hypothetical protein